MPHHMYNEFESIKREKGYMKKILTFIGIAVLLIASTTTVLAYDANAQVFPGYGGYSVVRYNPNSYTVTCKLTASNGAFYVFEVWPHRRSSHKWIANPHATYRYWCR